MKTIFAMIFVISALGITYTACSAQNQSVGIATDRETGTRFSVIDRDSYAGICLRRGPYTVGTLKIIGEVPRSVALADDSLAQAVIKSAGQAMRNACPQFRLLEIYNDLEIRLFYQNYRGWDADPVVIVKYNLDKGKVVRNYSNQSQEVAQREALRAKESALLTSAQVRPMASKNDFLFLLGEDTSTGTKFWNYSRDRAKPCWNWGGFSNTPHLLLGEVPKAVSLANNEVASSLVLKAGQSVLEKCGFLGAVRVHILYDGFREDCCTLGYSDYGPVEVDAVVDTRSGQSQAIKITGYKNNAYEAEQKRRAQEAEDARRKAEQSAKEAARQRRWNEFVRQYGVQEVVNESNLFTNPFQYQGKTIAATLRFERMMTANSAVFEGGHGAFVVSNIPTGTYKSKRDKQDLIAVTIIGMTELKGIPMVNSMQVPNLRFVGVHFCQDWNCGDILQK